MGSRPQQVVIVWGTRPEALKLGPVVYALRNQGVEPVLIATGQHSDLLRGTPAESDLKQSYSLGIRSDGDVNGWVMDAILRIASALPAKDAVVVVQGDTMSAYAAALAATDLGLPLVHLEAGIRSHSLAEPDPEERFRVEIGRMADLHLAPTELAAANLRAEHVAGEIVVTGNTVVSALQRYASLEHAPRPDNSILVTMHRREFLGLGPDHIGQTVKELYNVAREHPKTRFVWPMHPALLQSRRWDAGKPPFNVHVTGPLAYQALATTLRRSRGVLTDSGGLSEEAASLGVPCAVLRNVTDRPEAVSAGVARLFPPNPTGIRAGAEWILSGKAPRKPSACFGGPESAEIAASAIITHANSPSR